ncbi:MAG: hypothetical protein ICV60_11000 [Pyrinomonadaceae bacterium]|nr:hypothetical protein [Pyrinomonadaceae bacterium]
MRTFYKPVCLLLIALLSSLFPTVTHYAQRQGALAERGAGGSLSPNRQSSRGGIKEEIPDKYRERYEVWKSEFLSTETGRRQWEMYAHNEAFTLTINISTDNRQGATTGKYKWNDAGELTGATITLGSQLDEGYPDPIYYPVMNSLSWSGISEIVSGRLLAATKIAHEFGHINRALGTDATLYRLQNQLMPVYKRIFLSNGHDTRDPRLLKLARQMGGTSLEIWEDREYWGEANAMLYLRDRISEKNFRCVLFSRIRRTVEAYAEPYADRFKQIAQAEPSLCRWQ